MFRDPSFEFFWTGIKGLRPLQKLRMANLRFMGTRAFFFWREECIIFNRFSRGSVILKLKINEREKDRERHTERIWSTLPSVRNSEVKQEAPFQPVQPPLQSLPRASLENFFKKTGFLTQFHSASTLVQLEFSQFLISLRPSQDDTFPDEICTFFQANTMLALSRSPSQRWLSLLSSHPKVTIVNSPQHSLALHSLPLGLILSSIFDLLLSSC